MNLRNTIFKFTGIEYEKRQKWANPINEEVVVVVDLVVLILINTKSF